MAKTNLGIPSYIAWKCAIYEIIKATVEKIKAQQEDKSILNDYVMEIYSADLKNSNSFNKLSVGVVFLRKNPYLSPNKQRRIWTTVEELLTWDELENNLAARMDDFYDKVDYQLLMASSPVKFKSVDINFYDVSDKEVYVRLQNEIMSSVMEKGHNFKDVIWGTPGVYRSSFDFLSVLHMVDSRKKNKIDSQTLKDLSVQFFLLLKSQSIVAGKNQLSTLIKIMKYLGEFYSPTDVQKIFTYFLSRDEVKNKSLVLFLLHYCEREQVFEPELLRVLNYVEKEKDGTLNDAVLPYASRVDLTDLVIISLNKTMIQENFEYYVNMTSSESPVCLGMIPAIRDVAYKSIFDLMVNERLCSYLGEKAGITGFNYIKNFNGERVVMLNVNNDVYTEEKLNNAIGIVLNMLTLRTKLKPAKEKEPFLTLLSEDGIVFAESLLLSNVLSSNLQSLSANDAEMCEESLEKL